MIRILKPILPFAALLLPVMAMSQEVFYSMTDGSCKEYMNVDSNGNTVSYCIESVKDCHGTPGNGGLTYSYDFLDAEHKSIFKDGKSLDMVVTVSDGETKIKLNDLSKAAKSENYMTEGDLSTIPADIQVGDELKDSRVGIAVSFFKSHNLYTNRKVTGKETLTTPAGTFDCFIVECVSFPREKKASVFSRSWISLGIGVVKQEIVPQDGEARTMILIENK